MNNAISYRIKLLILGALVLAIVGCVMTDIIPAQLSLNTSLGLQDLAKTFAALMAWLFTVALFAERAVEVIVMVFRDQEADLLDDEEKKAAVILEKATAQSVYAANNPPSGVTLQTAGAAVDAARDKLAGIQERKTLYRAKTKEVALLISFVLGILVSCAGIHVLSGVLFKGDMDKTSVLFKILDISITGAVIAGGSEGIHRMANAFTSTMDSISTRADQAQK